VQLFGYYCELLKTFLTTELTETTEIKYLWSIRY